jgi:hypothetical protein
MPIYSLGPSNFSGEIQNNARIIQWEPPELQFPFEYLVNRTNVDYKMSPLSTRWLPNIQLYVQLYMQLYRSNSVFISI